MVTNSDAETFIRLAREASVPAMPADPAEIANALGIHKPLGASQLHKALYDIIRAEIVATQRQANLVNLRNLRSALVRRFKFKVDVEPHHKLPDWILYGVNEKHFLPLSEGDHWVKALRAVYALMALPEQGPGEHADQDSAVSRAALNLQARSYQLRLEGAQFIFADGEFERCSANIDARVRNIGGRVAITLLLQLLQRDGRLVRGRYRVGRNASMMPSPADPAVPYGYLLNVALRHMNQSPGNGNAGQQLAETISLAADLIAIADVETYSAYGFMFTDHESLPRYLQRLLLGDFWLSLRQLVAKDALTMIQGLFDWVDTTAMQAQLGWTIADAIKLAEFVLRTASPQAINLVYQRKDFIDAGLSATILGKMLPAFAHRTDELNSKFFTALDAPAATFDLKPLVWQPGNKFLLVSPPLSAISFFEALATAVRSLDKQGADNKIGLAIEPFLADVFIHHGIAPAVLSGKYVIGKTTYDCDLAIETTDAVILFEIKKKSLTRPAMGGLILEGLIDLSRSMIKAQTQLGLQEIQLLKNGQITFANGAALELRGRRVERIALTLLDWGSIQYRTVVDNIYKVLTSATIGATDTTDLQNDAIVESNRLLALLQVQNQELAALKGSQQQPFFDWHFLGVPQILFLLDGTKNANEFYANLRTIKHTVTGSLDMYETLAYMQKVSAAAARSP